MEVRHQISSGEKRFVQTEYFYIYLRELRVYFDKTNRAGEAVMLFVKNNNLSLSVAKTTTFSRFTRCPRFSFRFFFT